MNPFDTKWYYIGEDGNLHYLGSFLDFKEADCALVSLGIHTLYLFSEATAKEWLTRLTILLGE